MYNTTPSTDSDATAVNTLIPPSTLPRVSGLVLAGGRARRMDGCDKGLVELAGQPLIAHCLAAFAPQVDDLFISANRNITAYEGYGHPVLQDHHAGFDGPLAGLQRALESCRNDWLAVAPCDAPMLPGDLVARLLHANREQTSAAVIPHDGTQIQPLFGLYSTRVLNSLRRYLDGGDHKVRIWLETLAPLQVDFSDCPDAFTNINTPQDLELAGQRLHVAGEARAR